MQNVEPEPYRIGNIPFLGLTIWLDSHPLIPRPETEWWVEQLIAALAPEACAAEKSSVLLARRFEVPQNSRLGQTISSQTPRPPNVLPLRVLDLCAGSGAIGCAVLKHCPTARVSFGEVDPAHEATIRKNIRENSLDEARADVRIGDLFEPFKGERFDVIAANPPYIPEGRVLDSSVADYEPALALRAGEDGLAVIRRIATELKEHLTQDGVAWIECDIENIDEAKKLFAARGFTVNIMNDQYERPRVLVISS